MRTYDLNGETNIPISLPDFSDEALAKLVNDEAARKLHSIVIDAARDRILCLAKERDQARNAILAYGKGSSFDWDVLGRIDDLERDNKVLAEQRAELLADFLKVHDALHRVLCVFVPGNDVAALKCSELLKKTAAKWVDSNLDTIPSIPKRMEELKVVGFSSMNSTPDHHFYLDQLEQIVAGRRSAVLSLPTAKDVTMRRFDEDHSEQDIATIKAAGELLMGDVLGAGGDYKEDYTTLLNLRELAERRLNQLIESTPEQSK